MPNTSSNCQFFQRRISTNRRPALVVLCGGRGVPGGVTKSFVSSSTLLSSSLRLPLSFSLTLMALASTSLSVPTFAAAWTPPRNTAPTFTPAFLFHQKAKATSTTTTTSTLRLHKTQRKMSSLQASNHDNEEEKEEDAGDNTPIWIPYTDSVWASPKSKKWRTHALKECIPSLSSKHSHKGSAGRIGVLGGSVRYTGAPYYASMAALTAGADLAFVFCAQEASLPIKCYSPELMVAPVYSAADFDRLVQTNQTDSEEAERLVEHMVRQVSESMDKLHALVIGPGLGRCPLVFKATSRIIQLALSSSSSRTRGTGDTTAATLPLVLDADALYLLTLDPYQELLRTLLQIQEEGSTTTTSNSSSSTCPIIILTPNAMEWKRLKGVLHLLDTQQQQQQHTTTSTIRKNPNLWIVEKGRYDTIYSPSTAAAAVATTLDKEDTHGTPSQRHQQQQTKLFCKEVGGWKRSGGLGDILAGTLGTLVAWHVILSKDDKDKSDKGNTTTTTTTVVDETSNLPLACWTACSMVKRSTHMAFHEKHRAMTAPDVLVALGPAIHQMTTATTNKEDDEVDDDK